MPSLIGGTHYILRVLEVDELMFCPSASGTDELIILEAERDVLLGQVKCYATRFFLSSFRHLLGWFNVIFLFFSSAKLTIYCKLSLFLHKNLMFVSCQSRCVNGELGMVVY